MFETRCPKCNFRMTAQRASVLAEHQAAHLTSHLVPYYVVEGKPGTPLATIRDLVENKE